ncbi:sialate O-acetylesterase [Paraflavisolibacter sp. H34]|uniref:sialate O-acetylesterase n=1 Tax=Huijunlia imazamoxiresistens TaxID=3127457 RepID=UPI00301B5C98
MTRIKFFLAFLLLSLAGRAEVSLPKVLGSNMVLQRHKPVCIWGKAAAGEAVTVTFGKQVKKTVAAIEGSWQVFLSPLAASAQPAQLVVAGTNTLILDNVLVGEVWLCSGQSNMEFTMNKSSKYANAVHGKGLDPEALQQEKNGNIRLFLVKRDLNKGGDINKGWNAAEGEHLKAFSAAGYHFAKKLYEELRIPIGVISSSIPGSRIEPWMAPGDFAGTSGFRMTGSGDSLNVDGERVGKFYAGMIRPLAPFTLRGFLWYQGESNCMLNEREPYTRKLKMLIGNWRRTWKDEKLPFYFVQIAPFLYSGSNGGDQAHTPEALAEFREAQAAALSVPYTGMVVTTDLCDKLDDIHPTYKWEVGRRLALLALEKDYGKKVVASGPAFKKLKAAGNKLEIEFNHTGSGLVSRDGQALTWFELAGADGKFVPAEARLAGKKVVVSAPSIARPTAVRFAWNEAAQPNLFNREGLPTVPFRTLSNQKN